MSVIDISTLWGFPQFHISTLVIVNFAKSCDYHMWKTFKFLYVLSRQKLVVDTLFRIDYNSVEWFQKELGGVDCETHISTEHT